MTSIVILCYADLKAARFQYVCGFPAILSEPRWHIVKDSATIPGGRQLLSGRDAEAPHASYREFRTTVPQHQRGFFLARRSSNHAGTSRDSALWTFGRLSTSHEVFFSNTPANDRFIGFADPSGHPEFPGWMLRNLLVMVRKIWRTCNVQVLCVRGKSSQADSAHALLLHIDCGETKSSIAGPLAVDNNSVMPRVSGWERNQNAKLISHNIDLQGQMKPS